MSNVSRAIIDMVRNHLEEAGDSSHPVYIGMEGDLEHEIDAFLIDVVFPVPVEGEAK